jgi:hypothetical protein
VSATPVIKAITEEGVGEALVEAKIDLRVGTGAGKTLLLVEAILRHARPLQELDETAGSPLLVIIDNVHTLDAQNRIDLVNTLLGRIEQQSTQFRELIEILTPEPSVPSAATVDQARRNADARASFLAEFPTATSGEVAELVGSRSKNRAALANQWRAQGRVFAIPVGRELRYPLFQFDPQTGAPKPALKPVLAALTAAGFSGWQLALFWTGVLSSLDDRRPIDLLDSEPEQVIEAAATIADIPE